MKYDAFNLKITQTAHCSMPADKIIIASLKTTAQTKNTAKSVSNPKVL